MVDRGKVGDVNEAARRFAETLAESYSVVYGQAAESQERQRRLAQGFSELVATNLREQTEGGRAAAERLSEQANKQQEAGQALARESVEAYVEFLDTAFSRYRSGTARAAVVLAHGMGEHSLRYDRLGFVVQSLLQSACIFLVAGRLARQF